MDGQFLSISFYVQDCHWKPEIEKWEVLLKRTGTLMLKTESAFYLKKRNWKERVFYWEWKKRKGIELWAAPKPINIFKMVVVTTRKRVRTIEIQDDERKHRLMKDEENTLHHFYWKNFIWSKHPKGNFWLNLFSSGGLQEELNWRFEIILTRGTEKSLGAERKLFIYLNYILAPKYNKCCTHCLPIRYFIYAMAAYFIYFSRNTHFHWTIF